MNNELYVFSYLILGIDGNRNAVPQIEIPITADIF